MPQAEQAKDLAQLSRIDPRQGSRGWGTLVVWSPHGAGSLRWAGERQVSLVEEEKRSPRGRLFGRRRRANFEGGRRHRHEVKVSPEEEARLLRLALEQGVTVPRLLVESALASEAGETSTQRREAIAELFRIHRLLAAISNNVNQMARATNATGEVQAEMVSTLAAVRRTAQRIDDAVDELSLS